MSEKPTVLLIDFSALFRSAWHANANGPVSVAHDATIGGVGRAERMAPGCLVAICCDGRGNWRKEISKEYKAQRETQPQSMYGEMDRTRDRLRRDGRLVWQVDGFEADDIIATATQAAKTRGHTVLIASHDKDLLQLLCPSVEYLKTRGWTAVKHNDVFDEYGIECTQFRDWLAITGDRTDNIIGAVGVGAARARELLVKYRSIDGIAKASAEGTLEATPGIAKSIEKWIADGSTSIPLVSLRTDVPIDFDEIYKDRSRSDLESVQQKEESVSETELPEHPQADTVGSDESHGKPEESTTKVEGAYPPVASDGEIDMVNAPPHYRGTNSETIDVIEAFELNYHLGNVVKYILRADKKGAPIEDLMKASWYLSREIKRRSDPKTSNETE
jgi:5'-3' exonuclease